MRNYSPDLDGPAVFIGRPSKWGNPFRITPECSRKMAIEKFREMVYNNEKFLEEIRTELRGKNLVCYCSPKPCHGDVLLEVANNNLLDYFN
jgi:hypothetical protein